MLTDDEVMARLHDGMRGLVGELDPSPSLLASVRTAHTKAVRRQRLLAPAVGLAVAGLVSSGAVVVYQKGEGSPAQHLSSAPDPDPLNGEARKVLDLTFRFPVGFKIYEFPEVDWDKVNQAQARGGIGPRRSIGQGPSPSPGPVLTTGRTGLILAVRGSEEIHVSILRSYPGALSHEQMLQVERLDNQSHVVTKTVVAGREGYVISPKDSATGKARSFCRLRLYLSPNRFLEMRGVNGVTLATLVAMAENALSSPAR